MKNYLNNQLSLIKYSTIREFTEKAESLNALYYLTMGEPDFDTPQEIKDACHAALNQNLTHYGPAKGQLSTRKAICDFELAHYKTLYTPEEVIISQGASEALMTVFLSILNNDDEVIVPIPAFEAYEQAIKLSKGKFIPLDITSTDFQITKELLETVYSEKTKAIIITSPNNPTGVVLNDDSLKAIHDFFIDKNVFIISDDVYSKLVYSNDYSSIQKFNDLKNKLIIIQSFSKPYAMTGWRCGYILADEQLTNEFVKVHECMIVNVTSFVQPALEAALKYDPKEMVDEYKTRRDYAYKRIIDMGFECVYPKGAFYLFPSIKKFNMDSITFTNRLLNEKSVIVVPGITFGTDDYIRISYCVKMETIVKALDLLEEFINSLN